MHCLNFYTAIKGRPPAADDQRDYRVALIQNELLMRCWRLNSSVVYALLKEEYDAIALHGDIRFADVPMLINKLPSELASKLIAVLISDMGPGGVGTEQERCARLQSSLYPYFYNNSLGPVTYDLWGFSKAVEFIKGRYIRSGYNTAQLNALYRAGRCMLCTERDGKLYITPGGL